MSIKVFVAIFCFAALSYSVTIIKARRVSSISIISCAIIAIIVLGRVFWRRFNSTSETMRCVKIESQEDIRRAVPV